MYQTAYAKYKTEVIGVGKLYERYKDDFLNSHLYTDRLDAIGMNEHHRNYRIMESLLETRRDLVEKYFSRPEFSESAYHSMQHEFDTTLPAAPDFTLHSHDRPQKAPGQVGGFQSYFTTTQISLITKFVNEACLFSGVVTDEDLEKLFHTKLTIPLKSANNRRVAVFFDALCENNLICRQWQQVVDANRLILSSAKDVPLKCSNLSTALNEAKTENKSIYNSIRKMVQQIASD